MGAVVDSASKIMQFSVWYGGRTQSSTDIGQTHH